MVNFSKEKTVEWKDGEVVLIDQTKLPQRFTHVRYKDYRQVADAIQRMVVRGAPAIGVAAAMGLALAGQQSKAKNVEEMLRDLETAARVLRNTRPTAINLFWAIRRVVDSAKAAGSNVEAIKQAVVKEAVAMAVEDVEVNRSLGRHGAALLADGDAVLTHCRWL